MKRFQFPLEKVLKLRGQETEQAKRSLGRAMAAEEAARQAVVAAQIALAERLEATAGLEKAGMTAFAFASQRVYLAYLQSQVEEAEAYLSAARAETARRRMALLAARQREKALQRLRERRFEQYTLESLREEQKELDEFGSRLGLNAGVTGTEI